MDVTFLPESSMDSLLVSSLMKISVSNFIYDGYFSDDIMMEDLMQCYEILINHISQGDECSKELRDFILKAEYAGKRVVLDPKNLYFTKKNIENRKSSGIISGMLINAIVLGYDARKAKQKAKEMIDNYSSLKKQYKTKILDIYTKAYEQVLEIVG